MKKNSRLKSFFAILLAVSMIFQQSSLTVLATDDTYVEDATATPTLKTKQKHTQQRERNRLLRNRKNLSKCRKLLLRNKLRSQRKHLPSSQQKRQQSSRRKHLQNSQQRRLQQLRQKHLQQSPQRHLQK